MNILRVAVTAMTFSLFAAATARAQTPLTLAETVARALETSQRLAEARAREQGAQASVRLRRTADDPVVVLSGGYTRTNHVDEFAVFQPGVGASVIYPDVPDNYFTRVSFQWPIYTAGRTGALERAADAEARAAGAEVEIARADLKLEAARAYWALATAAESVRVLDQALARAEAHLRDVRARFDQGLIPPNEVSSAEAQRSRQQLQLIEAQNIRSSVLEDLRRLTGLTTDIAVADQLQPGPGETPPDEARRPELIALRERVNAAQEREDAVEAARKPSVALTGMADYARPNPRIFPRADVWNHSWELAVTGSWTLWDSGRNAAEAVEAAAATTALRARLADVDLSIRAEVRQRQLDLASARAALTTAADATRSAAEARRVVGERFAVGVATSTDVLDAQLALLQAELDQTRAFANVRLAEARLDRALGR
jgi:outer membrane protein TolC